MGTTVIAQGRVAPFMLSFFRRSVASPWGASLLGLILLAFIVTLYEGKSPFGGGNVFGTDGSTLATVGGEAVTDTEVKRILRQEFEAARAERPELDMATFVAAGSVERTLDRLIDAKALAVFGVTQNIVVGDRLIGASLANRPEFRGPDGKFDEKQYRGTIQQQGLTDEYVRTLFRNDIMLEMLQSPIRLATTTPKAMAEPYAALTLEKRTGAVAGVPITAFGSVPAPSEADLTAFYSKNIARYTVPERRVVRYAMFDRTRFEGKVTPSDDDIAKFYASNAKAYAASEKRSFTQLVVRSEPDAQRALAAIKAGTPIANVAKTAGLSPLTVALTDEAGFAKATNADVAKAAFAAAKGGVAAMVKSGLGYHIVRVDAVAVTAARTLAEARSSIIGELTQQKMDEAVSDLVKTIEDDAANGAVFDDLVKKNALTMLTPPPLIAAGTDPDQIDYKPPPEMGLILRDAFRADPNDESAVVQLGSSRSFALWHLDKVIAAAPRKLTDPQVRAQVIADAKTDTALKLAQKTTDAIVANVNKGTPFAQALASAGVALPPLQPLSLRRIDFERREQIPAPVQILFLMPEKRAHAVRLPEGQGWAIVYLDRIEQGDRSALPMLTDVRQKTFSADLGSEYLQQFLAAAKTKVVVTRDAAAIAAFKKSLIGGSTSQ
jgi:peptidyl-prolyl cis-trans isomerase D